MNAKVFQFLGLAMRAGKIISGEERVVLALQKQQVQLILLATDASQNTTKKIMDKAKTYRIPVLNMFNRQDLGRAIGKEARVVIGVTDKGFADELKRRAVT